MTEPPNAPAPAVHPHPTVRAVMRERWALACAVFSGLAIFLGFAGKEIYPLAFVSLAPLLVALRGRTGWLALRLGWVTGTVAVAGGFKPWTLGNRRPGVRLADLQRALLFRVLPAGRRLSDYFPGCHLDVRAASRDWLRPLRYAASGEVSLS